MPKPSFADVLRGWRKSNYFEEVFLHSPLLTVFVSSFGCIALVSQMMLDVLAEDCCILACTGLNLLDLNSSFSTGGIFFSACRQMMAGFTYTDTKKWSWDIIRVSSHRLSPLLGSHDFPNSLRHYGKHWIFLWIHSTAKAQKLASMSLKLVHSIESHFKLHLDIITKMKSWIHK